MLTDKALSTRTDVASTGKLDIKQQVNLPKLALPTFYGDPMKWAVFWQRFLAAVHNNDHLESAHKLTYLHEAIQDPTASPLLYSGSSSPTQYDELVQVLITRYDHKRLIHKYYSVALANCNSITKGTEDEIRSLVDTAEHYLRGLKDTGQDNLNAFLTSLFELKLSKRLHESWREHSKDTKTVPPIQLLDFLKEKMDALPESATTSHNTSARAEHKSEPRKHKTLVHAVQSTPPRNSCSTCNEERHALYVCPSYRAMIAILMYVLLIFVLAA